MNGSRSPSVGTGLLQKTMSFDYSAIDRLTTQPENEGEIVETGK
jgi:hypothetical protein